MAFENSTFVLCFLNLDVLLQIKHKLIEFNMFMTYKLLLTPKHESETDKLKRNMTQLKSENKKLKMKLNEEKI